MDHFLRNIADMGIVELPIVHAGMSATQKGQAQRRYESVSRDVTTLITDTIQSVVGLEERNRNFSHCNAFNLLVHDFGSEKIRFVCDLPRR